MKSQSKIQRLPIRLDRKSPAPSLKPFTEYFNGFEKVEAVRSVFGDGTEEVLRNLRIGFIPNRRMYMGVRDEDGNISVGTYHLRVSPTRTLYLDVIHELFHVKQRMKDAEYFHAEHMKFMADRALYYASPIEIPAYEHTVREAERIGMTRKEILEYLKFGYAPSKVWQNFLKKMNLKKGPNRARRVTRFPVGIKRETVPRLYAFTDYFIGFEKVQSVRKIFGDSTERILRDLKMEFIESLFPTIAPSEDDGHLVVTSDYFRTGSVTSIYLDTFLSLSMLKVSGEAGGASDGEALWGAPGTVQTYRAMVEEAKRIGLSDPEILPHLRLLRFVMPPQEYRRFLESLGLKPI